MIDCGRNYQQVQNEWKELTQIYNTDIIVLDMPLLNTTLHKDLLGTFISDLILQVLSFVSEQERTSIKERQRQGIEIARNIPNNFEEEYTKWKLEQQTAKTTMEHCCLKKNTFYTLVKEFEKIRKMED